jgi:signal transduction histidine kinase
MNFKSAKLNSVLLFCLLSFLAALFKYSAYQSELDSLKERTSYLFRVENQRVKQYLSRYSDVLYEYKDQLEKENSFDANQFDSLAKQFSLHFKDIQAFNFVSSEFEIVRVYPPEKNKAALGKNLSNHPDDVVSEFFKKGLPRDKLVFLPPVSIYQGGKAIIFYMPIIFKGGEQGWINVVILAENLFKNYRTTGEFEHVDFLVKDAVTGRFFIESAAKEDQREDHSFKTSLFNRDVIYIFNIAKDINRLHKHTFKDFFIISLIILILAILFYLYSKSREEIYSNYVSIRNESNLLKTLIHDLSNPIQVSLLGLQNFKQKHESSGVNLESLDYIIQNQTSAAEVINTVRSIYNQSGFILTKNELNVSSAINEVLSSLSGRMEDSKVKVELHLNQNSLGAVAISKEAFKNHILRNLLSNAIKFSKKNSTIRISFEGKILRIENLAETIDPNRFEQLNEIKEQESTEDNRGEVSLGLGLFIAKVFCEYANIRFLIAQDPDTGVVTTELVFD